MTVAGRRPIDRTTWLVVVSYVVLEASPFVLAATHAWFWKHEHSTAPVAGVVVAALLVALVLRQRWAWWLLVVFEAAILISFVFDFTNLPALLLNLASFALLVSPPMRRHVRAANAARSEASRPRPPRLDSRDSAYPPEAWATRRRCHPRVPHSRNSGRQVGRQGLERQLPLRTRRREERKSDRQTRWGDQAGGWLSPRSSRRKAAPR